MNQQHQVSGANSEAASQQQSREVAQELMLDDLNLLIVDHLSKMGFNSSAAFMHEEL